MALTGSTGLLGSSFKRLSNAQGIQIMPIAWQDALEHNPVDIAASLVKSGAGVLVHCAANTNVERCEDDPSETFRDNALVSEVFAAACASAGIRMVLISSTGIYGTGKDTPWTERDSPAPTTVHHRSKLAAERMVQATLPGALVLRAGWLFGRAPSGRRDFVTARLVEADQSTHMISNSGQFGNPTWVDDVGKTLLRLLAGGYTGVFNCVNSGRASRYDYVNEILTLGGRTTPLEARPADQFLRNAPVSHNEMAENWKLQMIGCDDLGDWRTALARCMKANGLTS